MESKGAYYFNPFSKTLAANVSANVSQALENGNNRGGKFGRYYVTRVSQFPAILAECGFVSNSEENEKLADPDYQEAIAEAIANAIYSYYQSVCGGEVVTGTQSVGDSSQAVGGDSSARPTIPRMGRRSTWRMLSSTRGIWSWKWGIWKP